MNIWQIILIVLNLGIGFYMVFSVMRTLVELTDYMKDYLQINAGNTTERAIIITVMLGVLVAISICPIFNMFICLAYNLYMDANKDALFIKYKEAYVKELNNDLE